jgi:hypothetical protein
MIRKTAAAAMAAAALAISGCNSHSTAPHHPAAAASSLAANPTVSADARQAEQLIAPCLTPGATYAAAKTCIGTKVPAGKRHALLGCLASAYAKDSGWTTAGWTAWKTQGAQPCVQAALR